MSRRILNVIQIVLLTFMTSGCWSKIEISDRTFTSGIFIDLADDGMVELSVLTPLPNRMSSAQGGATASGSIPYAVVSKTAPTLAEAFQSMQKDFSRRISWGQTRVLVIGFDYAEHGLKDMLEWLARQPSFPLKTFMYVAPGKAKEITKLTPVYEQTPAEVLNEFANLRTSMVTNLKQFLQGENSKLGNAVPLLSLEITPMVSEKGKLSPWSGKKGAALFKGDKLVGKVDLEGATAISWMQQSLKFPVYSIPLEDGHFSFVVDSIKSNIRPSLDGNQIRYRISIKGDAKVIANTSSMNLMKPEQLHEVEKLINEKLVADMEKVMRESQKLQADILQVGSVLEWWYPHKWEQVRYDWNDVYKDHVAFDFDSNVIIKHYNAEARPYFMVD